MATPKRRGEQDKYLVFISHASGDRWIARQMARLLDEHGGRFGVVTFLDEKDIEGGDLLAEKIRKSILACNEFVVLISPNSLTRPWVLIELGVAWGAGKKIIAIVDKVSVKDMPDILMPYKAVDLNEFDRYIQELLGRARKVRNVQK